ncbi:YlzJ-like family protein [Metabacillus sediminilitoris]|uniref:Ribonuclease n=1 Tax=Metabacillus sediminilitoris TaxID=2567941 RepID=A0A4S4C549_9BACI|nr:YlzJ-like family protein [Metabacillus sediminilitoris]QGQ46800.1 ribonuclease [Metabacillus sediminilitoris]THF82948.1 ribonuclease [Metabacillus sediminilitoris]
MIFYTTMPEQLMFPIMDEEYRKQSVVEMNGVQLLVQETTPSQYEVVRILSSDPQHYLDEQYCPGQKITMTFSTNGGKYGIIG